MNRSKQASTQASRKRLVALLSAFSAAIALAMYEARAENGSFEYDYCFASQLTTLKHSDSHVINLSNGHGTIRATTPGQLFDNMTAQCLGLVGQAETGAFAQGYCELIDNDGDRVLERFQRVGNEGAVKSVSGTGKYQNMKVEGSYTNGRFPQKPGMLLNCTRVKGRWERP